MQLRTHIVMRIVAMHIVALISMIGGWNSISVANRIPMMMMPTTTTIVIWVLVRVYILIAVWMCTTAIVISISSMELSHIFTCNIHNMKHKP